LANSVKRWNQWRRSNFRRRQLHGLAEELKVKALPIIEAAAQDENYNYHHFPEGTSLKNTKDCCNQRYGRGPRYGQTENSIEKYTDTFLYMFRHLFLL
jgi:hypothetical protein